MVRLYEIYDEDHKQSIEEIFYDNFRVVDGRISVDEGIVNVIGRCDVMLMEPMVRLPVTFGTITDDFNCVEQGLTTFKGFPKMIGGSLNCSKNLFTSLEHSPSQINGHFMCHSCSSLETLKGLTAKGTSLVIDECPIKSLEGLNAPLQNLHITWNPDLPLLRTVYYVTDGVLLLGQTEDKTTRRAVSRIINDFIKSLENAKKKLIDCQYALIKAGFKGNAKW